MRYCNTADAVPTSRAPKEPVSPRDLEYGTASGRPVRPESRTGSAGRCLLFPFFPSPLPLLPSFPRPRGDQQCQTPQQLELGTNWTSNQTNQLLGDHKPNRLRNQANCQALNWENWLLATNPSYKRLQCTTSSPLISHSARPSPPPHNPISLRT